MKVDTVHLNDRPASLDFWFEFGSKALGKATQPAPHAGSR